MMVAVGMGAMLERVVWGGVWRIVLLLLQLELELVEGLAGVKELTVGTCCKPFGDRVVEGSGLAKLGWLPELSDFGEVTELVSFLAKLSNLVFLFDL